MEAAEKPRDLDELYTQFKRWYSDDHAHFLAWANGPDNAINGDGGAREDFKFRDGDQWTDEQRRILQDQNRPTTVFNRIKPMIDSVVGYEVNNRHETRYIPRQPGASGFNEMLTAAGEWFRDQANAEFEESDAFRDAVTAGKGVIETRIDYEIDPDGKPCIERVDPFEVFPDADARKPNFSDARRVWRVRKMSMDEARDMFPNVDEAMLHAGWATSEAENVTEDNPGDDYDTASQYDDDTRRNCTIVECQWYETETVIRFVDGMTGEEMTVSRAEYMTMLERLSMMTPETMAMMGVAPPAASVEQRRRVYKRVFLGREIIEGPSPLPVEGTFTYKFITGFRDQTSGHFFGMVRATKDPQRWLNKNFSQIMHILNSSAKGGIMAERGAFEDDRDASDSWARSDSITWANPGALQKGMIQPKPQTPLPAGQAEMLSFAMGVMPQVTGVNLEMLGMKEGAQAGVLEYQRRQAGLTILAPLFDQLRRYRIDQGRLMLKMIQKYLSDGRLIRIIDGEHIQYVPLTRDMTTGDYEVIVDEAPTSPNAKERNWSVISQMLPILQPAMTPELGAEMVRHSPLPDAFANKVAASLTAPKPPPPPDPKVMELQAKAMEADKQREFEIIKMREEFALKAQMEAQSRAETLQMEAAKLQRQMEIEVAQGEADIAVERYKAQLQAAVNEQKIRLEADLKLMEMQWREREKAQEAMLGTAQRDVSAEGQRMIAEALANGNAMLAQAVDRLGSGQAMQAQAMGSVAATMSAPRQTRVIRDPVTNQIIGTEQVT